jgi:hypothetical protein
MGPRSYIPPTLGESRTVTHDARGLRPEEFLRSLGTASQIAAV